MSAIQQWIEIPEGMEIPPAARPSVDRIGVTAPKVDSVGGAGRHDRQRRAAGVSRARRFARWAA